MDATQRAGLLQRWSVVQEELIPELGRETEALTPRLMKLIHTLEWARIEEFVPGWQGVGRPPADRSALANGFVAKAVLGLTTTVALIERLTIDRALRRICGFSRWNKLPDEATFSRAFAEFAASRLAERVHEAWTVDCEYNRDGTEPKRLGHLELYPDSEDDEAKTVFPDVIVHRRGTRKNYLVSLLSG